MITETQKAYAAGLLDGEGTIGVNKTGGTGYQIGIANLNMQMLEFLQSTFGGKIYRQGNKNYKRWELFTKKEVLEFLLLVEPYLIVKKKQSQLMIELLNTRVHKKAGLAYRFTDNEKSLISQIRSYYREKVLKYSS